MPILLKFMLRHALIGYGVAVVFVAAIFALDVGGLATLVATSRFGVLAVALLTFFTGLTFASLQMGMAIMSLRSDAEEDGPSGHAADIEPWPIPPAPASAPVPVPVRERR